MATSQAVQVVFLSEPRIGERASVLINGQPASTSQIVKVQTDPRYPGWFWVDTDSGSRYGGQMDTGQQTIYGALPTNTTTPLSANTKAAGPVAKSAKSAGAPTVNPTGANSAVKPVKSAYGMIFLVIIILLALRGCVSLTGSGSNHSGSNSDYSSGNDSSNSGGSSDSSNSSDTSDTSELGRKAVIASHRFAETQLTSPSTARFQNSYEVSVSESGGRYSFTTYVDSQNSFGAEVRTYYTCTMNRSGSGEWDYNCVSLDFAGQ